MLVATSRTRRSSQRRVIGRPSSGGSSRTASTAPAFGADRLAFELVPRRGGAPARRRSGTAVRLRHRPRTHRRKRLEMGAKRGCRLMESRMSLRGRRFLRVTNCSGRARRAAVVLARDLKRARSPPPPPTRKAADGGWGKLRQLLRELEGSRRREADPVREEGSLRLLGAPRRLRRRPVAELTRRGPTERRGSDPRVQM